MKRGAIAVGCAAAALLLGQSSAVAAAPVRVATSLTPQWLFFADVVTAHVDVIYDPKIVAGDSLRIEASLAPWEAIGPQHTSAPMPGHRSWRFVVACLSVDCLPRGTAVQRFHLTAVRVVGTTRIGQPIAVRASWPTLRIAGRFLPTTTSGLRPVFKLDTALPAATYSVSPSALSLGLDIGGALLCAVGLCVLAVTAVQWRASRRTPPSIAPLDRALRLLREAQERDADDRRRAAGLVARALSTETHSLVSRAAAIAWSPPEPEPGELAELARALEREREASK